MAPKPSLSLENIQEIIGIIFDQTQASLANHKKNCVALYKLHLQASEITHPAKNGIAVKLVGERKFGDVFIDMVNRILVIKKGPVTADRVVKFVGGYVKFLNEKVVAEKAKAASSSSISASSPEEDDDTVASRFVSRLLKWLFQGFLAKNKNVRYRCVFIVSEMISHLGEIDEDTYELLRESLMERICDKESLIRAHAVVALSKLIGSEDPDEVEDGEKTILEVLLDVVSYDPAAEVRRSALLNLPLLESTLQTVLARTRDTDPLTRKLVYSSVLQAKLNHPQQLSLAQREKVIKDGLGDREPSVRVAAGKLVVSWFDAVLSDKEAIQEVSWTGDDGGIMRGFISFLSLFDVVGPGEAIAVDAVLSVFVTRPEIPDMFVFSDDFWTDLSPESAVLARIFVEHCINNKHEARLETASLPVVTAFAFHIQEVYNVMLEVLQESENSRLLRAGQEDQSPDDEFEEELAKCEVVLGELLRMSLKLDYGDEIGRRKVFSVVKGMLAHPELPPGLIERCVDVLKEIMPSERDLIRVVVEIIVELRDGEDDGHEEDILVGMDESQSDITQTTSRKDRSLRRSKNRAQMSAEERMEADVTDIRCLMLCIAVLERVDSNFEDNSTLEGILADLIIPSVKRKELAMREKALVSLGLCCLIAQNMALSSFQLFVSQVQSAPDDLKVQVLRIIFDLLIMYDHELFGHSEDISKRIVDFLLHTLEAEEAPAAQAVLCTGICKLLLTGIITDPRVLTGLVLTYVSPSTLDNIEVRQCLSYFFPVYCYSSTDNQSRMQSIFLSTYDLMVRMYEERDDDQDMITPYQLGLLFVDWTNPQKAAEIGAQSHREVHVDLAVDILGALYDSDRSDDNYKIFCQLLGHLNTESGLDERSIQKLNILLTHHETQCPFEDPTITKIFDRFKNRFNNLFEKELSRIDPQQYIDEEFQEIYELAAVDPPQADDEGPRVPRSRRPSTGSVTSEEENVASVDDLESSRMSSPKWNKAKQARQQSRSAVGQRSQRSDESDDDGNATDEALALGSTATVTPQKKGVKRSYTPGSGTLSSPANRKRNRTNGAKKSHPTRAAETETDSDGASTPTEQRRRPIRTVSTQNASSDEDDTEISRTMRRSNAADDGLGQSSDDVAEYSD